MKILVLSSHGINDVAHGIGVIVHNSLRCLLDLGHQAEVVQIIDDRQATRGFCFGQSRSEFTAALAVTRFTREIDPRSDALRALTGHFLRHQEKLFITEARRRSEKCDLAIWFGHLLDPLTGKLASACKCPLLLHVNDSITLARRHRSRTVLGNIQTAIARYQESSVVRCIRPHEIGMVYVAEADRQSAVSMAKRGDAESIFCVPLAVDADIFIPVARNKLNSPPPVILFTGTMNFAPNVSAAARLVNNVLPYLPSPLEVRLAGRNPNELVLGLSSVDNRVRVTGEVHDIVREYQAADVFVAPMSGSSGMKNKLLEAMACELPVVASPEACGGFDGCPPGILVGKTDGDIASLVRQLLESPELRQETGRKGRAYVLENHSWMDRTRHLIGLLHLHPNFL